MQPTLVSVPRRFPMKIMCRGKERLDIALTELLKTPKDQQTKKDQDTFREMEELHRKCTQEDLSLCRLIFIRQKQENVR